MLDESHITQVKDQKNIEDTALPANPIIASEQT